MPEPLNKGIRRNSLIYDFFNMYAFIICTLTLIYNRQTGVLKITVC